MKKYIVAIILAIFFIGFIIGFKNNYNLQNFLKFTFYWKSIIFFIIVLITSLLLSFIGIPCYLFLLIIEILLLGIITASFFLAFSVKGIFFVIIYSLIFKSGYWFLLLLNTFYGFKLFKNELRCFFKKYKDCKNNIKIYFKKILVINSFMLILLCFTNVVGIKIVNIFYEFLIL